VFFVSVLTCVGLLSPPLGCSFEGFGKVYIVVCYYSMIVEVVDVAIAKYNKMWAKVNDVLTDARKRVEAIVEDICRMVYVDIGGKLEELSRQYGFTYVIEPWVEGCNGSGIVPCVYVEGTEEDVSRVRSAIVEAYPEVVSESRLIFKRKPREVPIE